MRPGELIRLAALMRRLASPGAAFPTGPVNCSREHTPSGTVFDLYRHRKKNRGTWVMVHGVTVNGGEEPRLKRFAYSAARSGVTCVVPTLEGLASCRWEPGDLEALLDVIVTVSNNNRQPVGLMGFSYGGSYCLLAAARQEGVPYVRQVISFGAYHSMKTLLEAYLKAEEIEPRSNEEWDDRIYRCLVLLWGYGDTTSLPLEARREMESLLRRYCSEASLEEKKQFYHRYLQGLHLTGMIRQVSKPGVLEQLSPHGKLSGLECPVTLIHQENDPVVPQEHADRLYEELRSLDNPGRFRLVITRLLSHVSPANIFNIPDAIRLSRAMAPLVIEDHL